MALPRRRAAGSAVGFASADTGGLRRLIVSVALLIVWAVPAPALAGDVRVPVKSLLEMRQERVVVQDFDLSCGAAALATLLTYQHGDPVSERTVARGLIEREEYLAAPELVRVQQGFSLLDLKRYVKSRGYEGVGYGELGLEDLADLAPAVVPVDFNGYPHFVVFRGIVGDRVSLADPAFGNRSIRIQRFEDAWLELPAFGRVGFVVERRDGKTPPNLLDPHQGDVLTTSGAALRQAVFE